VGVLVEEICKHLRMEGYYVVAVLLHVLACRCGATCCHLSISPGWWWVLQQPTSAQAKVCFLHSPLPATSPTRRRCSEVAYPMTTYAGQPLPVQCPQPSSEPTQTQCYHADASVLAYSESTNVVVSTMVHFAWASHAADVHVPLHHHQTPCTQTLRQLGLIVGWIAT
jgi:hypothetical protein